MMPHLTAISVLALCCKGMQYSISEFHKVSIMDKQKRKRTELTLEKVELIREFEKFGNIQYYKVTFTLTYKYASTGIKLK